MGELRVLAAMECEFSQREKSLEEDAELQRSTKKVKESILGPVFGANVSYKDKLVGEMPGAFAQAFNLSSEDDFSDEPRMDVEGLQSGLVAVRLSPETRKQIRSKWASSLIVKVVGRAVGFHFLRNRVMSLWKPAGRLDCVDLGRDFFLMRFGFVEDYNNVLSGGPWFVGEHFLSIRRWEPNFKPSMASCSLVAVWVRLPELPFEYYELTVLKEIGNAIGPVLRIDSNTASEARGRFAKICVQIDLDKPLVNQILLEGFVQDIQYEGVHSLCFSCGRVGHRREGCPHTIKVQNLEPQGEEVTMNRENGGTGDGERNSQEAGKVIVEGKSDFGPWMLVRRRKGGPNSKGGRMGNLSPGPSPSKSHVMTSGAYDPSFMTSPDRPVMGEAQEGAGRSRGKEKGTVGTVDKWQGAVPSSSRSVESLQVSHQSNHYVGPSLVPSFEFGCVSPPRSSISGGKGAVRGARSHTYNKASGSAKAEQSGSSHGVGADGSLGYLPARESDDSITGDADANQSQPDHDLGLVRQRRDGGLEIHFPGDASKPPGGIASLVRSGVDGVGSPVVDFPIGQANKCGGKDLWVEGAITAISGTKLERIKSGGRFKGKDYVDNRGRSSEVLGKRDFRDSGQGHSLPLQSACLLSGTTVGDTGVHDGCGRGDGIAQEAAKGDGMEVSEQGEGLGSA